MPAVNAQKQKKIKFERRIRLNHNIDKLPDAIHEYLKRYLIQNFSAASRREGTIGTVKLATTLGYDG